MAQKKEPKDNSIKYYSKIFWRLFFLFLTSIVLFFLLASWGFFGKMPSFEDLENPESNLATEIYFNDGLPMGKYYNENRSAIKYKDLPKHLVDALVSTEDERFYEHSGIDGKGTLRAIAAMGRDGGASTITQQLAKLLFHKERSKNKFVAITQKIKEWIIAVKLERQYTKSEIIAMYFNRVDFVNTAVGIRSAAKVYFDKEPRDLTIEESAMLVGMLTNPSYFNPNRSPERTIVRRNVVLHQMVRNGFLEESAKLELQKKPIKLNFHPESHLDGTANYFREYLRDFMKKWTSENKKENGDNYDIYKDGLKIYTTIDSKMQKFAEEAVQTHLKNLQKAFFNAQRGNKNAPFLDLTTNETNSVLKHSMKASERWRILSSLGKSEDEIIKSFSIKTKMKVFTWNGEKDTIITPMDSIRYYKHFLQVGMMSMEPQTGEIKAWVGGINFKYFKYDHVGQGARQVGSTFKPFVYATAIDQLGMSPCDTIVDRPFVIHRGKYGLGRNWQPHNSDGRYRGMITLQKALANSVNTISAKLIDRTGPDAVIDLAHKLGVSSKIPNTPAIALGAVDITVKEMVGAFSTFANQGVFIKPQFISRIEDKNGNIVYEPESEAKDVLNWDVAFAVVKLMEGVTEEGTGKRLRTGGVAGLTNYNYKFDNAIAGKTGTTQNNSDGWFIGMVPNLTTGVWVGCEDRSARFRSTAMGQGATMALPIWGLYMNKCYSDKTLNISKEDFEAPQETQIKYDCNGKLGKSSTLKTNTPTPKSDTDEFGI